MKAAAIGEEKVFTDFKLLKGNMHNTVERVVQWLKNRGVNPRISKGDIVEKNVLKAMASKEYGCASFNMYTGEITMPSFGVLNKPLQEIFTMGIMEHEFFHRGDYLEKEGRRRKVRRRIYEKWDEMRKIHQELQKYKKHLDDEHPLQQAIAEIGLGGYSKEESILKLWSKDPATFKKNLAIATALRIAEKNKDIDKVAIQDAKREVKIYFMQTPTGQKDNDKYFKVLSEIPAYMILEYILSNNPERGIQTAKETLSDREYFRGTELEDVARKAADNYLHLAHTLREKGLDDEQIVRAILALHKNIYTPEDAEMFVQNKRMLGNAAEAVKAGGFDAKDIRTALAVQTLVKMDENVKAIEKEKTRKVDR